MGGKISHHLLISLWKTSWDNTRGFGLHSSVALMLPLLLTHAAKLMGQPWALSQGGPEQHVWCFTDCVPVAAGGDASKPGCMRVAGLSSHAVIGTDPVCRRPEVGQAFPGRRNQEWMSSMAVSHLLWAQGNGISSSFPFGEVLHRSWSQYCLLSVYMSATLGRAWLLTFTKSSREVKLFRYCACDASILQKGF